MNAAKPPLAQQAGGDSFPYLPRSPASCACGLCSVISARNNTFDERGKKKLSQNFLRETTYLLSKSSEKLCCRNTHERERVAIEMHSKKKMRKARQTLSLIGMPFANFFFRLHSIFFFFFFNPHAKTLTLFCHAD